jgi:hypothetical protein
MRSSEATLPMMGGISVGVGVSDGVGGMGVTDGVYVKVGSGVRVDSGVAVKRGVILTIGASVAVGACETLSAPAPEQAALTPTITARMRRDAGNFNTDQHLFTHYPTGARITANGRRRKA